MKIKCKPGDLGRLEREFARRAPTEAKKALAASAARAIPVLQAAARNARPTRPGAPRGAVATGLFLRSWKFALHTKWEVRIYNDAPYALYVEEGRSAGATPPPVSAIAAWMALRGMDTSPSKVAALARAIGERGIPGRFIANTLRSRISAMLRAGLSEAATRALYGAGSTSG